MLVLSAALRLQRVITFCFILKRCCASLFIFLVLAGSNSFLFVGRLKSGDIPFSALASSAFIKASGALEICKSLAAGWCPRHAKKSALLPGSAVEAVSRGMVIRSNLSGKSDVPRYGICSFSTLSTGNNFWYNETLLLERLVCSKDRAQSYAVKCSLVYFQDIILYLQMY